MARIAYFQPFSGVSGDMALGALLDAGLTLPELENKLTSLRLAGWKLMAEKEMRGAFQATRLHVILEQAPESHHHDHAHAHEPPPAWRSERENGDEHTHHHRHDHHAHHPERSHAQSQQGASDHGPNGHRNLSDILSLVHSSDLPAEVKSLSTSVFQRLGEAEARVHGIPLEQVHFHEVGAVDSIVDIVATCLGLHLLGVEQVYSAPVTVGTGFVKCAHGTMPLPAPATLELLRGHPVEQRETRAELTTPTGAALLTGLARGFGTMPPMVVDAIGYGAGDDRPGPIPNVLRLVLGESISSPPRRDRIVVLEANLDDMSSEWLGHLMDRLFEAGAVDVSFAPVFMKKNRPAHELKVLAPLEAETRVVRTLFAKARRSGSDARRPNV